MTDPRFVGSLTAELERWVADGLVTAEQARRIRESYPGAAGGDDPRSRAVHALAAVGAVAVGFGVVLFFAANWEGMPRPTRLALLVVALAAAYGAAYELRERRGNYPRVGEALYLLGVILFGASLFLVGQMYHVQAHDPLALLLWALAAAAVAAIVRSPAVAVTAVAVFGGWLVFEFTVAADDQDVDTWAALPVVLGLYGAALYGSGTAGRARLGPSGFARAMRGLGLPLAATGLFVFTFSEAAAELGGAREIGGLPRLGLLVLVLVTLAAAGALALSRRRGAYAEAAALAATALLFLVPALAGGSEDVGLAYALAFNVVFAAIALGTLYAGYASDEPWLVNVGVAMIALDILGRYFDVFWSALPRSLGLIGAGVVVLGIALVLERQRRRLLARMAA